MVPGIDAHTVDQHRGVIAFRAAHEDRGRLARVRRCAQISMPPCPISKRGQIGGKRALDLVARDDYDRHRQFVDRGCRARRGDDHFRPGASRPIHSRRRHAPRTRQRRYHSAGPNPLLKSHRKLPHARPRDQMADKPGNAGGGGWL